MPEVSVTFAADEKLVRAAEEIAAKNHTDLSAMFKRYLAALASAHESIDESMLPPVTRSAMGLLGNVPNKPYKELLSDALVEKYRLDK